MDRRRPTAQGGPGRLGLPGGASGPARAAVENPYRMLEGGSPGRIGWRIDYFDELASTQVAGAGLARDGAAHGTVVVAERQSAGRGRLGRAWYSPPGVNLYLTVILRPAGPAAELAKLSLVAGVAAAEALETVAPGIVGLKWPNDLWLAGLKAGGILAEAPTNARGELSCVLLGIGLNVNLGASDLPPELCGRATSVRIATGRPCDRVRLAGALLSRLDNRYMENETRGFAPIRTAWERFSAVTGRTVAVTDRATSLRGRVVGIDDDGALVLDTGGALARVIAGDVSLTDSGE